ncbi:MAG: XylR family transcriptional regulator [Isosphaera sp.]|nr:XylR family transcriptional regulator [Isosphaera sp.]
MGYARRHGPWTFTLTEHGRGEVRRNELAGWAGDGAIARVENRRVAAALRGFGRPVVDVSAARLLPAVPWVETDDAAIARAAADHLRGRGFRHFGYCGDGRFNWSRWRRAAFREYLAASGLGCSDAPDRADALAGWVRGLPKPAGVFACYDIRGREVLDACRRAGVRVPDEVAVVGVDDDELLCELSDPPLSSVVPDAARAGWVAAELLDALMAGREVAAVEHPIPPRGVTTRRSTDTLAVDDPDLAAALRYIREHACDGIGVGEVVAEVAVSRRALEGRFRRALGRTPHAEIARVRLERARELLGRGGLTLEAVARRSGFGHGEYLSTVFRREFGMTPGEYRARNAR